MGNMLELDIKLKENECSYSVYDCMFRIISKLDHMVVTFQDGTQLGVLNTHISKALEALLVRPSI